ncbi:hypothetical protein SNE40_021402 [Patella caerulea]|uniref:NmrA-like family domain-containing protein 1 n=2 Tax=Patella caerulea TaxID=87958 RepID=A0AAN8GCM5_PATCE
MPGFFHFLNDRSDVYRMGCGASLDSRDIDQLNVVVFGATGMIGGAVIRSLLRTGPKFKVKAVTRTPTSDAARQLAEDGVIIATADLNDSRSLERALNGTSCVFLSTHYWEHLNKDKEIHQGMNAVDACVACDVQHIIFLGAENSKRVTGKDCGYLEAKAAIEEYIVEKSAPGQGYTLNYTFLRLPFLYENLLSLFKPHLVKPDVYALALPLDDTSIECMSINDVGRCVYTIITRPKQYLNKTIRISADRLTVQQMADILTKQIEDKRFVCPKIRTKDYENFEFKGASDLAAMFEFYQVSEHGGDMKLTKKLYGSVSPFDKWVHDNKEKFLDILKEE